MRLIDADALHALMMAEATQMDDPFAKMFTCAAASEVLHAPTIDAVPAEWIKKYMSRCLAIEQDAIGEMVKEWAEREEE